MRFPRLHWAILPNPDFLRLVDKSRGEEDIAFVDWSKSMVAIESVEGTLAREYGDVYQEG